MKTHALAVALIVLSATTVLSVFLFTNAEANEDVVIVTNTIYQTEGFPPFSFDKGDYFVAGEVSNTGDQAFHFNITALFYDSKGELIGSSSLSDSLADAAPSYLHVILPGKKSPFTIFLSRFNETGHFRLVDHYSLAVITTPATLFRSGFKIVSQSSHTTAGTLLIEGEIENIGTEYVDGFMVFATFYNEAGEVAAVTSEGGSYPAVDPVTGERGFPPNQTAYFSVKLEDFREGGMLQIVDRYELTAEGYDYSSWTAGGQLINPEVVYILGSVQSEEDGDQSDGFPLALYFAVVAIIIALLVVTLLMLRKRKTKKKELLQDT